MLKTAESVNPRWQRKRYSPFARQIDIFRSAVWLPILLAWDKIRGLDNSRQRRRRARWVVDRVLDLGPTFIKIGQSLSTRPDLIPVEYIEALEELQDRVPPFPGEVAIAVVETELNQSIQHLFQEFEVYPLASASLGQVHVAKLHNGEEVVIKVQRPGVKELFDLDFAILGRLLGFLNFWLPGLRKYKLEEVYREFFGILYQEIDYLHEGANADRFRENFSYYDRVRIPAVYWRYTTQKVLALEYVPGIKVDDRASLEACGINVDEVIQLGICSYLKQLLEDGFFQSDPHPGNMAVSQDGSLIFYDFGTMTEVRAIAKDQMVKTFFAVLRKDAEEVVSTLTYMGLIEPVGDMTPVKRMVGFLLERFRERPVDIREFDQIREELAAMFEQQPFRLPPQMTFIIKALTTLDGIARSLDPQYNLLAASQPFIKKIAASGKTQGSLLGELARQAKFFIQQRFNQPSRVEVYLHRLEERIDQGELQIRIRATESDRLLRRVNLALKCLIYACISGFSLIAGVLLLPIYSGGAIAFFSFSGLWFIFCLRAILRLRLRERLDRLATR
ncbi:MAG: AarF/ABC1/UbiB kinase family protein [Jaaginema sp. PMC 1079.18]|nr:AarF/ABC1/UbiB kinase family protein [Jaaginema sp. PMC 1080.18]MEC4850584.1 AarF/ABC1/UbiB kinase family protein [Jaaginema sp. PMC 1079.18]MEC4867084.1 AarF/ABC1/UbiB kinase family protein [Jaaginema sp. PMC 1078.18]